MERMLDLSFLTEKEYQIISEVLNRDEEISKREDARIRLIPVLSN